MGCVINGGWCRTLNSVRVERIIMLIGRVLHIYIAYSNVIGLMDPLT